MRHVHMASTLSQVSRVKLNAVPPGTNEGVGGADIPALLGPPKKAHKPTDCMAAQDDWGMKISGIRNRLPNGRRKAVRERAERDWPIYLEWKSHEKHMDAQNEGVMHPRLGGIRGVNGTEEHPSPHIGQRSRRRNPPPPPALYFGELFELRPVGGKYPFRYDTT